MLRKIDKIKLGLRLIYLLVFIYMKKLFWPYPWPVKVSWARDLTYATAVTQIAFFFFSLNSVFWRTELYILIKCILLFFKNSMDHGFGVVSNKSLPNLLVVMKYTVTLENQFDSVLKI